MGYNSAQHGLRGSPIVIGEGLDNIAVSLIDRKTKQETLAEGARQFDKEHERMLGQDAETVRKNKAFEALEQHKNETNRIKEVAAAEYKNAETEEKRQGIQFKTYDKIMEMGQKAGVQFLSLYDPKASDSEKTQQIQYLIDNSPQMRAAFLNKRGEKISMEMFNRIGGHDLQAKVVGGAVQLFNGGKLIGTIGEGDFLARVQMGSEEWARASTLVKTLGDEDAGHTVAAVGALELNKTLGGQGGKFLDQKVNQGLKVNQQRFDIANAELAQNANDANAAVTRNDALNKEGLRREMDVLGKEHTINNADLSMKAAAAQRDIKDAGQSTAEQLNRQAATIEAETKLVNAVGERTAGIIKAGVNYSMTNAAVALGMDINSPVTNNGDNYESMEDVAIDLESTIASNARIIEDVLGVPKNQWGQGDTQDVATAILMMRARNDDEKPMFNRIFGGIDTRGQLQKDQFQEALKYAKEYGRTGRIPEQARAEGFNPQNRVTTLPPAQNKGLRAQPTGFAGFK